MQEKKIRKLFLNSIINLRPDKKKYKKDVYNFNNKKSSMQKK